MTALGGNMLAALSQVEESGATATLAGAGIGGMFAAIDHAQSAPPQNLPNVANKGSNLPDFT